MPSRRPAPTILLTATVATAMILPWAADPNPVDRPAAAVATGLTHQPLPPVPAGRTVREVAQDRPFSMVALTGADLTGTSARVRARQPDGSWGSWYRVEHEVDHDAESALDADHPDRPNGRPSGPDGTEPVFVGSTTAVQIELSRNTAAPTTAPTPARAPVHHAAAKPGLGYRPATAEQPLPQTISAVLISPPRAPFDGQWTPPAAITGPGQPPGIIPRSQWGAPASSRCSGPASEGRVRAAVVHHTAGGNDYAPQDSAEIVRGIYAYHTRALGWCDIGYNALVDKYGQVFEGRAGGIAKPVQGTHAGGFNRDTWGVSMIGSFEHSPPPPIQIRTVGRLLGWRLWLDIADPRSEVQLVSAGGSYTAFARGTRVTLPTIIGHRDVDITECPGDAGYAALDEIRDIAMRFNEPPGPQDLARSMEGGAIHARWQELGGFDGMLGAPTSPEAGGDGLARYATFDRGAVYWSPQTGAQPVVGAIYTAWASLGYERGALGLPTSAEIQEPEWVGQNFQHGTLNFDRAAGTVTRVIDGVAEDVPPPPPEGPPVQVERFSPIEVEAAAAG